VPLEARRAPFLGTARQRADVGDEVRSAAYRESWPDLASRGCPAAAVANALHAKGCRRAKSNGIGSSPRNTASGGFAQPPFVGEGVAVSGRGRGAFSSLATLVGLSFLRWPSLAARTAARSRRRPVKQPVPLPVLEGRRMIPNPTRKPATYYPPSGSSARGRARHVPGERSVHVLAERVCREGKCCGRRGKQSVPAAPFVGVSTRLEQEESETSGTRVVVATLRQLSRAAAERRARTRTAARAKPQPLPLPCSEHVQTRRRGGQVAAALTYSLSPSICQHPALRGSRELRASELHAAP